MGKPVIGLIGGMGSGKSCVAAEFARHGGRIVSGDRLGHEALRQPEIRAAVIRRFGKEIVGSDGEIDRGKLGPLVFADEQQRKELESLVFPYIERRIGEEIEEAGSDPAASFIVLDAAIMLETGWNKVCRWLVYIDVPRELRLDRLARQRGWTETEVAARESAQMPLGEKASSADFILDNSGSPEAMAEQVARLVHRLGLLPLAGTRPG
jgi:dephospho-CoA kinase